MLVAAATHAYQRANARKHTCARQRTHARARTHGHAGTHKHQNPGDVVHWTRHAHAHTHTHTQHAGWEALPTQNGGMELKQHILRVQLLTPQAADCRMVLQARHRGRRAWQSIRSCSNKTGMHTLYGNAAQGALAGDPLRYTTTASRWKADQASPWSNGVNGLLSKHSSIVLRQDCASEQQTHAGGRMHMD